jgi:MSHA biogenesis protein MshI
MLVVETGCFWEEIGLFSFGSPTSQGSVAVAFSPAGFGVVKVDNPMAERPKLSACDFVPQSDGLARHMGRLAIKKAWHTGVIAGSDYRLLQLDAPQVPTDEMDAAVRWRIKDFIEFPLDQAQVDSFPIPGRTEQDPVRSVYATVAKKEVVKNYLKQMQGAGMHPTRINIRELALRNLTRFMPENEKGLALLHLDDKSGSISIFRDGLLYLTRQIDLGSTQMNAALPESMESDLPQELRDQLDAIVLELQRSLDFYESQYAKPPVAGVVVTPLAHPVPQLIPYLTANLGVTARAFDLSSVCEVNGPIPDDIQARCIVAAGAALGEQR